MAQDDDTGGGDGYVERIFPALGFDPTPGNADKVNALLLEMTSALRVLGTVLPRLTDAIGDTDSADWGGDAAEEYSDHTDDVDDGLAAATDSIATATEALSIWATQLVTNQQRADELELKAKQLKAAHADAQAAYQAAFAALPSSPDHPRLAELMRDCEVAKDRLATVESSQERVLAEARRLRDKHNKEAAEAAAQIRDRADGIFAVENDDFWVQLADTVAKASEVVSLATGAAAAVCAATGIGAPVGLVLGTVSAASGAISLGAGLAQQQLGSENAPSKRELGASLLFDVVPGGKLAEAGGRQAARALMKRSADGMTDALRADIRAVLRSEGTTSVLSDISKYRKYGLDGTTARELRDTGRDVARRNDVLDSLPKNPAERLTELKELGAAQSRIDGLKDVVEKTPEIMEAAGLPMTPGQERTLEMIQLGLDPSDYVHDKVSGMAEDRARSWVEGK